MGASKYFADNRDVDKRIKAEIYVVGPLNALLWGCEAWNLTKEPQENNGFSSWSDQKNIIHPMESS